MLATFARRALRNPRLAWALIAEPVDPRVDAERLAYRARYAELIAAGLAAGIEAGELPEQNVKPHGGRARGRLRRGAGRARCRRWRPRDPAAEEIVEALRTFVGRAVGAP